MKLLAMGTKHQQWNLFASCLVVEKYKWIFRNKIQASDINIAIYRVKNTLSVHQRNATSMEFCINQNSVWLCGNFDGVCGTCDIMLVHIFHVREASWENSVYTDGSNRPRNPSSKGTKPPYLAGSSLNSKSAADCEMLWTLTFRFMGHTNY